MRFIPLFSGSSGNSSLIEAGGVRLLVDAGLTGKAIADALKSISIDPDSISGILVTHDHSTTRRASACFRASTTSPSTRTPEPTRRWRRS
ncbi:MAG: MBL fold metallo-hydrolase [Clostridia bacterium]|nr:MBL fold metallo-hydrolase [Clostridia bacterium]